MNLQDAYKKARGIVGDKMELTDATEYPDFWDFGFMPKVPESELWMYSGTTVTIRKDTGDSIPFSRWECDDDLLDKAKDIELSSLSM